MAPRIAVVSGANKGIGLAIVKNLAANLDNGIIYLCARSEKAGLAAVEDVRKAVPNAKSTITFHQLDITNSTSILELKDYLAKTHGGLDILINNAGFAFKRDATEPFGEQAKVSIAVNYAGTRDMGAVLFPILRPHARVVNVSSQCSIMRWNNLSADLEKKLLDESLSTEGLDRIMTDFVESASAGNHVEKGYSKSSYGMSKVGVTALTRIQQRNLDSDPREDIIVTACCPGYCATDMSSHMGYRTPEQGADTPCWLARVPENWDGPKGRFFYERKEKDWVVGPAELSPPTRE